MVVKVAAAAAAAVAACVVALSCRPVYGWNIPGASQFRIALTGVAGEATVSFRLPESMPWASVRFREEDSSSWQLAEAPCTTYNSAGGFTCTAVVRATPGARVIYTGEAAPGFPSAQRMFVAPRERSEVVASGGFRACIKGDEGTQQSTYTVRRVTALTQLGDVDFVHHVGDISYADDGARGYGFEVFESWLDSYGELIEAQTSAVPYMASPGNHDYDCEVEGCVSYSRNFSSYIGRFALPKNSASSGRGMWYSYDYGNVHFVSTSTETDYPNAPYPPVFGDQLAWLEGDLRAARQDPLTKWIVLMGHRPIYSSCDGYWNASAGEPLGQGLFIRAAFESLMVKYGVSLVITAHVHSYERSRPVAFGQVQPGAPIHVVNGAAGNVEGIEGKFVKPAPAWSVTTFAEAHSFAILEADDSTLTYTQIRSDTGAQVDRFVVQ